VRRMSNRPCVPSFTVTRFVRVCPAAVSTTEGASLLSTGGTKPFG
jgi:hypothetical protein